ncbi:TetR/AcrR family transcriptional regulator [Actinomadura sp. 9N407]|uniref:TetR/AcrR family transcriptional regulator n=1 Tax=Actinomadura sp. 9N407 TaxID=3375154 RepID=UPI0037B98F19
MGASSHQTLTERRAEELRRSVALTALDLFVLDGGTGTTIERICDRAGISQRTFHRHFAAKEDVVAPLFEDAGKTIVEGLRTASVDVPVTAALVGVFSVRGFGTNPAVIFQRRFLAMVMDSPGYLLRWHALDPVLTGPLADFFARRGVAGVESFERELRAGLVLQATRLAYHRWLRTDASEEQQDLRNLDDLLERALSAVVPPQGVAPVTE